jgi:UDP-glucose 4-epimerase
MTLLVTGGAGYIGAHVVRALVRDGVSVVVLDDLSTGDASRVDPAAQLVTGSLLDRSLVRSVLRDGAVTGVVHIAAKKQVGESVADPLLYYRENVEGLVSLLDGCRDAGVDQFVFSSSAATYGLPDVDLVTEDTPCVPLSPYGESKLVGEWLLRACDSAYGLRTMSLRYFNVAGAASPELGDPGVFNLIPLVFQALAAGERPRVFGGDYPTPDGTCVRDYVHVADIAEAHLAAARALASGAPSATYNIGRGEGSSVLDVLRVVAEVTGKPTDHEVVARRPGDPARVVAAVDRIRVGLGFTATRDLEDMVSSAWAGWQHRRG